MSELKLERCPFCNDEANLKKNTNRDGIISHAVFCIWCEASTRYFIVLEQAIKMWNERSYN